ncbi:tryptophan-rich sensory protein [Gelidibacter sp. DF109]|uniref:Tryptophan-rich sensory protein n=1 Tax=Gelidibacter pelagius TaxID=2819985 RepID=A0ABS3SX21_9FLAO|nr:tryptophan-rich sensory protein [Gelidibacter pelagius]
MENKKLLLGLLILYYILSLVWNPIFFQYQQILAGLFLIIGLAVVVGFIMFYYWTNVKLKSLLVVPYFLWLIFATSLNAYILIKN